MKIFISYGHDHRELGRRIYLDLHDKGHQVWFDERNDEGGIQPAERWEESIERGLETADWIIALMSPHAMRRPDGVCLDELSYGRFLNRPIVPMMVQMVRPPLCIARLQYIDLQNWQNQETGGIREDWYQQQFGLLEQTLSGERKLGFEGQQSTLRALLQPIDNDSEIARHLKNFTGREWLISEYETWRDTDQQSRIFWITGDPGIGKSAIASILCHRDPSVVGIHFCKFDESDRRNPERAIQSLAYQLATQIPDYQSVLLEMGNREQLAEKDIGSQFSALFEPLAKFPQDKRHVLIIDALDESSDQNGKNSLADTIANNIDKFPSWLGLVITSRPEPELIRRLSRNSLQPRILSASDGRNLDDIECYLRKNLKDALPTDQYETVITALLEKCEGSFLYAKEVTRTLLRGELDPNVPESFPTGLTGIYNQFFERRFPDLDDYEDKIRPLIELLVAAITPLPEETAKNILGWKRREWDDTLLALGSMFPRREGKLHLFHKSLRDWLEDPMRSGNYRVYAEDGHEKVAIYYWQKFGQTELLDSYGKRCFSEHLLSINTPKLFGDINKFSEKFTHYLNSEIHDPVLDVGEITPYDQDNQPGKICTHFILTSASRHWISGETSLDCLYLITRTIAGYKGLVDTLFLNNPDPYSFSYETTGRNKNPYENLNESRAGVFRSLIDIGKIKKSDSFQLPDDFVYFIPNDDDEISIMIPILPKNVVREDEGYFNYLNDFKYVSVKKSCTDLLLVGSS